MLLQLWLSSQLLLLYWLFNFGCFVAVAFVKDLLSAVRVIAYLLPVAVIAVNAFVELVYLRL